MLAWLSAWGADLHIADATATHYLLLQ